MGTWNRGIQGHSGHGGDRMRMVWAFRGIESANRAFPKEKGQQHQDFDDTRGFPGEDGKRNKNILLFDFLL